MPRRDSDPFSSYRFKLELGSIQVAGFAECTGLQIETKFFEYPEGGQNNTTRKFPERTTYGNITLKKGITNSNDLIEWQLDVVNGQFTKNARRDNPNIAILLMDEKNEKVKRWELIRAFPVKWIGPDLKANTSEIAIENLELAHEGIQVR